jgi:hypothetical protein
MKGSSIMAMATLLPILVVSILIGFWVYGSVSGIVPHDRSISNESICVSCALLTAYEFDNNPILNDTDLICTNNTGTTTLTRGVDVPTDCLGYNVIGLRTINLTNTSASECSFENVRCDYTYDWANTNEQGFWDSVTTNVNSSFALGSILPLVWAAVIIIVAIFLLQRSG